MTTAPLQKSISSRAWAELILLSLIWGGSFLSIRIALDELPPMTTVAHRVFWAMLILWAYVVIKRLPIPKDPKIWFGFLGMGVLNNVIPFCLMAWGQLHIETGLTSILNASTAVFGVVVVAFFFADERLTTRRLLGVCIGFLGVATAIGLSSLAQFDLRSWAQLAILGGTFSYALASVWGRKRLIGLEPQVAAAGMVTGATLIMVPLAYVMDGAFTFDLEVRTWGAIGYYAVIATAFAYLLYYRVMAMAGSGNLMLCTLLVAPVAIVLGAVVLDEALPPQAYAGFALIAVGLLILNSKRR